MVCGTCGATIAEKAIVCYRCGTATVRPPVPGRPAPTPAPASRPWVSVVALVGVACVTGSLALPSADVLLPDMAWWTGGALSLLVAGYLASTR